MKFFDNMNSDDKLTAVIAISVFILFDVIMICVTLMEIFGK